ncbi:hypothetical protein JCM11491_004522 [Sporobolomyces phaffii]
MSSSHSPSEHHGAPLGASQGNDLIEKLETIQGDLIKGETTLFALAERPGPLTIGCVVAATHGLANDREHRLFASRILIGVQIDNVQPFKDQESRIAQLKGEITLLKEYSAALAADWAGLDVSQILEFYRRAGPFFSFLTSPKPVTSLIQICSRSGTVGPGSETRKGEQRIEAVEASVLA